MSTMQRTVHCSARREGGQPRNAGSRAKKEARAGRTTTEGRDTLMLPRAVLDELQVVEEEEQEEPQLLLQIVRTGMVKIARASLVVAAASGTTSNSSSEGRPPPPEFRYVLQHII
jgi:hypothetical protein